MTRCPKCSSAENVKNGFHHEKQRYKCKKCQYQFTRTTPRGRPPEEKAAAILLYSVGLSMRTVGRILKVSASAVLRWIRTFAEETYEKPEPQEAVVVELDEMWHYIQSKKTSFGSGRLIVVTRVNSSTGSVAIAIKPLSLGCLKD